MDPGGATIDRIRRGGQLAWALLGMAGCIAVLLWLASRVAIVWPPLLLAGAIVFLLNPLVTALQRRGLPRAAGAGLAYLGLVALVVLAGLLIAPLAADQAAELQDELPEIGDRIEAWIDERAADSRGTFYEFTRDELTGAFTAEDTEISAQLGRLAEVGIQVFHVLLVVVLAPIIAFYLLVDLPRLRRVAEHLVPAGARGEVEVVAHRLNRAIGGFFRGQLAVALIVGVMVSIGLLIIGLRFWFLVGMIAGLFNVIPLIGPYIGGIPGVIIALTTGTPVQALLVVVVMVVAQQIDNHFITPQVMQRAVHLHPATVMLALLAGGELFGFLGLLLAVPGAAVLKILIGHLWRVHVLGQSLDEVAEEQLAADERADPVVKDVATEPANQGAGTGRAD